MTQTRRHMMWIKQNRAPMWNFPGKELDIGK